MIKHLRVFVVLSIAVLGGAGVCTNVCAASKSLITAQAFPETFNDLSFVDRVQVLADGYEVWESVFDSSGRCISGCAYQSITLQEKLEEMELSTQAANQHLAMLEQQRGYGKLNFYDRNIPLGMPLRDSPPVSSEYGRPRYNADGTQRPHEGIDFAVPTGTNVYTTADGIVENVWTDRTCGKAVKIKHSDEFQTLYCHLSQQLVNKGDTVTKGQLIALSGNTGASDGAHLHYGIKRNGTYVDPRAFISR